VCGWWCVVDCVWLSDNERLVVGGWWCMVD
jgi:hypothetical protein